jgi:hypothetical protein
LERLGNAFKYGVPSRARRTWRVTRCEGRCSAKAVDTSFGWTLSQRALPREQIGLVRQGLAYCQGSPTASPVTHGSAANRHTGEPSLDVPWRRIAPKYPCWGSTSLAGGRRWATPLFIIPVIGRARKDAPPPRQRLRIMIRPASIILFRLCLGG